MLFEFATEHLLSERRAIKITKPLWPELTAIWSDAWKLFKDITEETRRRIERSPIAKANVLNALAADLALERFSDRQDERIEVCTRLQFVKLYVTKYALLRFNALTSNMIVRNVKSSPQKEAYFLHEPIAGLRSSAPRFTVGYRPDAAHANLDRVAISLQVGDTPAYHFFIDGADVSSEPITTPQNPPKVPPTKTQSEKLRKYIH
jgi:hypothetical protein